MCSSVGKLVVGLCVGCVREYEVVVVAVSVVESDREYGRENSESSAGR